MRFAAILAVISLASVSAAQAQGWQTYTNARFGYSICYPAGLLQPQPEADNSDGRVFTGKDVELRVYGHYSNGQTLQAALQEDRIGSGGTVTYKAVIKNSYVLSGTKGGSIFYAKTIKSGDTFVSFQLTYPKVLAPRWTQAVGAIAACLRASH